MEKNNENIKLFFGNSLKMIIFKIFGGLILFLLVNFIHSVSWRIVDYWSSGWPFHYYESWGPCLVELECQSSNNFALFLDIAIWYLSFCFITFLFQEKRKI